MKLMEVFNSKPLPIKWTSQRESNWRGSFDVEGIPFFIQFDEGYDDQFEIAFGYDVKLSSRTGTSTSNPKLKDKIKKYEDIFKILGTGNQGKVFSTVLDGIKQFIRKKKPRVLQFSAEEPSRMKLYKRMVNKFASSFGYDIKMSGDYFELVRKGS